MHIYQNSFYGSFVVGRDKRMDWKSFSFISYVVWEMWYGYVVCEMWYGRCGMGDAVVKIRMCELISMYRRLCSMCACIIHHNFIQRHTKLILCSMYLP